MTTDEKIGFEIIQMFNLKEIKEQKGHYTTSWGSKTALGIGRCIQRIVEQETRESGDNTLEKQGQA
jgi:hypothetical protein